MGLGLHADAGPRTGRVTVGDTEREFKMWSGEKLTSGELDDYLSEDGARVYRSIREAFHSEEVL